MNKTSSTDDWLQNTKMIHVLKDKHKKLEMQYNVIGVLLPKLIEHLQNFTQSQLDSPSEHKYIFE